MSRNDYHAALERILVMCNQSRTYTRRLQSIHETAMYALGMTASQRNERHIKIMERVGTEPMLNRYQERLARRTALQKENGAAS